MKIILGKYSRKTSEKVDEVKRKYTLSYEEWMSLKEKQREIRGKIIQLKENEIDKLKQFNRKIDNSYKVIK